MLLVNDGFGALACALNHFSPELWSDSVVAHHSASYNIEANQLNKIRTIKSTDNPGKIYNIILIKLPKNNAFLEHQLICLKQCISRDTKIIAAGMVKHMQKSQFELLEDIIGTTKTSLAQKKARLVFLEPDIALLNTKKLSPYPTRLTCPDLNIELYNHANVFSRDKLDIGTRFMLSQFDKLPRAHKIIDLGCGSGVLGIIGKRRQQSLYNIQASICFIDESYMAIRSSIDNFSNAFPDQVHDAQYEVNDGLNSLAIDNVDLILCNPPFHQNHTISDHIAWSMFNDSKSVLNKEGELWVVGNRQLNYHIKLKSIFKNCETIAANSKFVVLRAINK